MKHACRSAFAVALLLIIAATSAWLVPSSVALLVSDRSQEASVGIRARVTQAVRACVPFKSAIVNLNGGACRAIGRRICNKRIMCSNGIVCECKTKVPSGHNTTGCEKVERLQGICRRRGIPFVLVVAPAKCDVGLEMMPTGWDCEGNVNLWAHSCCEHFKSNGVNTVDLTMRYAATPDDVARNFFKTDHHWKTTCAFDAVRVTARELAALLDVPGLEAHPNIDPGNWDWRVLNGAFLGSHGRRTGGCFSGVDDFEYGVPLFKTSMSRRFFRTGEVWEGTFEDSIITKSRIDDGLPETKYSIVCGGDEKWARLQNTRKDRRMLITNHMAPFDKKVFISRDSFGIPFSGYISVLFHETFVNDPRNMPPGVDEEALIDSFAPDVVIRVVYALSLKGKAVGRGDNT